MRWWAGFHQNSRFVERALSRGTLNSDEIRDLINRAHQFFYPDGQALITDLMIDPPAARYYAAAFRETNINAEKELDNSVLWKAVQALHSAVTGMKIARYRSRFKFVSRYAEVITEAEDREQDLDSLYSQLEEALRGFDQFHPVIVVESPLWFVSEDDLLEVPWCRFVQANSRGIPHFWVDVVRLDAFQDYCTEIAEGYRNTFANVDAEQSTDEFLM